MELHKQATNKKAGEGRPRRSISLATWSRDQKVCSVIQSNILGNFIDKDMHYERTGQMRAVKYLKESCYHHFECSVANSVAALMRKWYLNSTFQPYNYSQRFQEGADGTRINTSNLMYTWRVEIKERREYKIEGRLRWKGIRELREEYYSTKNYNCNQIQELYIRTYLLGLYQKWFSLNKTSLLHFIVIGISYNCHPTC